jgi:ribosomal protein S1
MSTVNEETTDQDEGIEVRDDQMQEIAAKKKMEGRVIKITLAGAIVDVGADQPGMLHISRLRKTPVNRVEDVLEEGQTVEVWVRRVDQQSGRLELTMIEPLELEWREIKQDMVLRGKVTRLESFGAFVEIGAERPGLVHVSEITHGYIRTPGEVVKVGDEVEVKVIGVNRRKKRIQLSMKALEKAPAKESKQRQAEAEEEVELDNEPVPTAMEMAMREAMERTKDEEQPVEKKERSPKKDDELEDILARTLEQEVRSS